jgi:hypothetical protein
MSSSIRRKVAIVFVAMYASCLLAPHATMAFAYGGNAAHCLTELASTPHRHQAVAGHVHKDGTAHEHGMAAKMQGQPKADDVQTTCCGLFAMSALAANVDSVVMAPPPGKALPFVAPDSLAGHPPGCLHRPPIV